MKRFLGYIKDIPIGKKIKYCTILISFVVLFLFLALGSFIKNMLPDLNTYKKWDLDGGYVQMSVYLPVGFMQDTMSYDGMMYQMQENLKKEGVEAKNQKSRVMIGAYSGYGQVSMQTDMTTLDVNAIGVGGDFFYFHPIELIDGTYLASDYLMQDYVLLDKETAWKLFGAINVTGMTVMIGDIPFLVAGVYEPTDVLLSKEAGIQESMVFMFYDSLEEYGNVSGIQWLDFIIPNPVKDFADKILKENGIVSLEQAVVIDNSTRFQAFSLYKLIPDYFGRVMSKTGIVYPYWENVARGYENILVAFLVIETVCLTYGVVLLLMVIKPIKNIKRGIKVCVSKIKGRKSL